MFCGSELDDPCWKAPLTLRQSKRGVERKVVLVARLCEWPSRGFVDVILFCVFSGTRSWVLLTVLYSASCSITFKNGGVGSYACSHRMVASASPLPATPSCGSCLLSRVFRCSRLAALIVYIENNAATDQPPFGGGLAVPPQVDVFACHEFGVVHIYVS